MTVIQKPRTVITAGNRNGLGGNVVDVERAAPRPRAPHNSISALVGRMLKRHGGCILCTMSLAIGVGILTTVVVEPFNYKAAAQNNKGVRAMWVLLSIFGLVITAINAASIPEFNETSSEIKSQMERRLPNLTSIGGRILGYPWSILRVFLNFAWVAGPFFRYVFNMLRWSWNNHAEWINVTPLPYPISFLLVVF